MCNLVVMCLELQILEAKTAELRLQKVNGTYMDLTLNCVGERKSAPQWRHNGMIVNEAMDTVMNMALDLDNHRRSVTMTRHNVTERFAGRYQCVDTNFFQSDSDILTVHAGAHITYPGTWSIAVID